MDEELPDGRAVDDLDLWMKEMYVEGGIVRLFSSSGSDKGARAVRLMTSKLD